MALATGILALLSIAFFDQLITQNVTTKKFVFLYRPIRELTDLAEGKYYFFAVFLLGLLSFLKIQLSRWQKKTPPDVIFKLYSWSLYAFTCLLGSGLVLQILKHIFGRQRPHVSDDVNPHVFDFFNTQWHYHSMPSGHTQTVFTFATVLWITFPRLGRWIFFVAAALAFTRLPLEEHFLSDVLVGSFVGFAMTVLISSRFGKIRLTSG